MAIEFNDNLHVKINRPTDFRFGPFANIAQANATIPIAQRYHGLIFGVYTTPLNIATSDIKFYYYWDGLTNSDIKELEAKAPVNGSYANQAAMIAAQATQVDQYIYYDGTSYWEYLGTTNGNITDYRRIDNPITLGFGLSFDLSGNLRLGNLNSNSNYTELDFSIPPSGVYDYNQYVVKAEELNKYLGEYEFYFDRDSTIDYWYIKHDLYTKSNSYITSTKLTETYLYSRSGTAIPGETFAEVIVGASRINQSIPSTGEISIRFNTDFDASSSQKGIRVTDSVYNRGAYYSGDYEANFIARSLVTKQYVDTGLAGKQNALGFTPENIANKSTLTTLGTSDTLYPTQNAVKSYVDTGLSGKQNTLGFTPENVANKAINLTSPDNTKYPTTLAVSTALAGKQDILTNPVTGTGTSGQVSFWNGTTTQTGDSGLTWNNTTKTLQVTTGSTAGILFAGTRLYEAQNQTTFTQLSVQPSSGNKAGVLQFLPSGTGNQSVLEFFEQSNPLDPTKRHIIRNNNSLLQIGGDGASKALEFISNNVSRMRMFSNGNFGFFTTTDAGFLVDINGTARIQNDLTLSDTRNIILGTGTGTKIGTATTQKIGFFNATPIVQPSGNIVTALQNLGLVASGSLFSGLTTNRIVKATSATTIGDGILADDSFGVYNTGKGNSTFFGYEAGLNDDGTDNLNVFVGNAAGKFNTSGIRNNFYGLQAGRDNTTGSYNNFFGSIAGRVNTTGSYNCFFGDASGVANTTGNYNCFFGLSAGEYHTSGDFNTFYGFSSGNNNATGSNNTFVGANSGSFIATGASLTTVNNSVFIGLDTRANANSQTNQIVIGYQAIGQGSNTITIGNTSITDNYIRGNFNITDARNLIIGTTTGTKIGTATSQKLSFWNATPIVQPTTAIAESAFVENAGGTAVNDDSTFDGYTLRQVVKALRDAGLLA